MRRVGTLALLSGLLLFAALAQIAPSDRGLFAPAGHTAALHGDGGDPGGLFAADDDRLAHPTAGLPLIRPSLPQMAPRLPAGDSIDLPPPGPVPRGA
jgi:hypothetical protein